MSSKDGVGTTSWETLLRYIYTDYKIPQDRLLSLQENVAQLKTALQFNSTKPFEVPGTSNQNKSEKWISLRKILITASKCKSFLNLQKNKLEECLREHMWFSRQIVNKYTSYGIRNEINAVTRYQEQTGNGVRETGLWVNPKFIGLGASPDRIVVDRNTNEHGLLEVKCPYVLEKFFPNELQKLTPSQRRAFCCTLDENNDLLLKSTHKYYFQVQMQMAIVEASWCDFVIWSAKEINIERIYFDELFWTSISRELLDFHENYMCIEYFEQRLPRNLKLFSLRELI